VTSGEESEEDQVDGDASTNLNNTGNVNSDVVADSSVPAIVVVEETLLCSRLAGECAKTAPSLSAGPFSSTLAEDVDVGDLSLKKDAVTTPVHCGEGAWNPVLQNHGGQPPKHETCDRVGEIEINKSTNWLLGDKNTNTAAVCEHCEEHIADSTELPAELENLISAPINIPESTKTGVVNGGVCVQQPRPLGSISEDVKPPMPLTSDRVGSGGGSVHFPSFYRSRTKSIMSNPRFTPAGSFIIPADEDIYVDLSCGLFSTDPGHVGQVQDVSALPSPPERPFTIGDNDETDLVYYCANDSIAGDLIAGGQLLRSRRTSEAQSEGHHSDSEVSTKKRSTSPVGIKVEMIDATSRDVLEEIFKRTSGQFASVIPIHCEIIERNLLCKMASL